MNDGFGSFPSVPGTAAAVVRELQVLPYAERMTALALAARMVERASSDDAVLPSWETPLAMGQVWVPGRTRMMPREITFLDALRVGFAHPRGQSLETRVEFRAWTRRHFCRLQPAAGADPELRKPAAAARPAPRPLPFKTGR